MTNQQAPVLRNNMATKYPQRSAPLRPNGYPDLTPRLLQELVPFVNDQECRGSHFSVGFGSRSLYDIRVLAALKTFLNRRGILCAFESKRICQTCAPREHKETCVGTAHGFHYYFTVYRNADYVVVDEDEYSKWFF